MRRISIPNPSVDTTYRTYINSDYSSGTALTVASNVSYAINDLIITGNPREELTEEKKVNTLSGSTTLNLASGLNFAHPKGTPVYKVIWDFISIEGRSTSSGTFAELTQSPIQWDNEDGLTIYYHSPGTNTWEYRYRFYNSVTATYSEYSSTLTGAIPARTTVRYMLDETRKIAGDIEGKIVSDFELIRLFNRGQDIIYAHNPRYFFLYVDTFELGSLSIAATASKKVYTLAGLTNYGELAGIKYKYLSGSTEQLYRLKQISEAEFDRLDSNQKRSPFDWPTVYKLLPPDSSSSNGYFKITPAIQNSGIGTFYPLYYKKMPDLDSVDDTTLVPLPELLVDFAIGFVFRVKGNEQKANIYEGSLIEQVYSIRGRTVIVEPKGLKMLDKFDQASKTAGGQPKSLVSFRGQKVITRLYGNKFAAIQSQDYIRENYF